MQVRYSYLKQKFASTEFRETVFAEFNKLLDEGDFTLGKAVQEFERRFAELIGVRHAIGVANGTDALRLALQASGVGPGDEVITGANSFIASAGAIAECGATPIFVDMSPWFTLDAERIERAITEKTKAILPVHYTGEPAEMDRILEIGAKYGIPIVEDACQAVLAEYKGKMCGTFGRAGAFSLHPLKNLNVFGDGGVVTTNDEAVAREIRLRRNHGMRNRDEVVVLGCNSRLDTLQAIVGNALIGETRETTTRRRLNADYYDTGLKKIPNIKLPPRRAHVRSCFHLYMFHVELPEQFEDVKSRREFRDELVDFLIQNGIEAKVHYPIPMYRQECFGAQIGSFTHADDQAETVVTLPVDEHLTREQQNYCIQMVAKFMQAQA